MLKKYVIAMFREWILWIFVALDVIGLFIVYAPLTNNKISEVSIPPVVFWLVPLIGIVWAGYKVYSSESRTSDDETRHRESDRKVFAELNELLPSSGSIKWLREYDFGSAFRVGWLRDLHRFEEKATDPNFEFLDAELEDLRINLHKKISEFIQVIGLETFPTVPAGKSDMVNRIPYEMSYQDPERFKRVQDRINRLAEEVAKAYDELIKQARRKL